MPSTQNIHRKYSLILEFIFIFFLLPTLVFFWMPKPLLPLLWVLAFVCGLLLYRDENFDRENLWRPGEIRRFIKPLLIQFVFVSILTGMVMYITIPELLFSLIKLSPLLWLVVMIFYPLLSVYPQELIYRTFFFRRYEALVKNPRLLVALNALVFGYMHIIFHNWIAVALTTIGGVLFARVYMRSRSTLLVSLIHALYGSSIFTLGLGQFFYHGSIEMVAESFKF